MEWVLPTLIITQTFAACIAVVDPSTGTVVTAVSSRRGGGAFALGVATAIVGRAPVHF